MTAPSPSDRASKKPAARPVSHSTKAFIYAPNGRLCAVTHSPIAYFSGTDPASAARQMRPHSRKRIPAINGRHTRKPGVGHSR